MAQDSKIEWTTHTANLWWGCTKVHEGCDNCYAEYFSDVRYKNDLWGNDKPRKMVRKVWTDLEKYQRLAEVAGEVHRVFVGSMMDIFEKSMPLIDSKGEPAMGKFQGAIFEFERQLETGDLRKKLFEAISQNKYPNLMFLLLTKRPSNINKYIPEAWKITPPENVMFGTSPVNQKTFDTLVSQLFKVNGKRFLSMEPQLDHITLDKNFTPDEVEQIHWIIQGGESGHNRRPFNINWAYSMEMQCNDHGIPFFFKQIDKIIPVPEDLLIREFPKF